MIKCSFCQYDNEEGALFCEQCKSDLGVLEATEPAPAAVPSQEEEAMEPPIPEMRQSVPTARPVSLGNLASLDAEIPVARPVNAPEAQAETSMVLASVSPQSSPGPMGTVDSLKTFV